MAKHYDANIIRDEMSRAFMTVVNSLLFVVAVVVVFVVIVVVAVRWSSSYSPVAEGF